ncbi:MAG TPA: hypothetical protein VIO57_10035 [Chloroflexota bacterium]|jgi:uncharacterized membrane protein
MGKAIPKSNQKPSDGATKEEAAWGEPVWSEPRWPAALAVIAAIVLYQTLPARYTLGAPAWLLSAVEAGLLIPLFATSPRRSNHEARWQRVFSLLLIALVNLANVVSLIALINALLEGHQVAGKNLLFYGAQIWFTNVLVFALWYWELDRGGPGARCAPHHREPDFLFPQMANPGSAPVDWHPSFMDYLYVSFTNATAFSPTDTMPLTAWAKLLMTIQSLASLITVALVGARAVNILGQ